MGLVRTDLAPYGFVCRDFGSAPQRSMDYQTVLQKHHMVADKSDKDSSAVVGNFDMGQTTVALEVAGDHKMAGLQTEFEKQAEFDRFVEIELQLAFENRMGSGVQPGGKTQVEQCQKDVL